MSWCRKSPQGKFHIAIGSFKEEYSNVVKIISLNYNNEKTGEDGKFNSVAEFDHPYPPTKIMWSPPNHTLSSKELIATTGDYLRIWSTDLKSGSNVEMRAMLTNNKQAEYCAPLTSCDWNETDTTMIGVCSIDTTCTIWDLVKQQPKTHIIAHEKEVFDISFTTGCTVFATVGADGSLRLFDTRNLEHSTILFETSDNSPLMRLCWNKLDPNYIATNMCDGNKTFIIDIRMPSMPFAELLGHHSASSVNAIAWAPHSPCHICTAGDDRQALIWDISRTAGIPGQGSGQGSGGLDPGVVTIEDPVLAYNAEAEINQLQWCSSHEDYIGIAYSNYVQLLKV